MNTDPIDFNTLQNVYGSNSISASSNFGVIITRALPYIFTFAGIMLLVFLIIGGFKYLTSAGNEKSIESAKGTITSALIGFILLFMSYWIVQLVGLILNNQQIINIF